ncbi:discoidin domain-containing protein [Dactylosporangium sp. NPDC049525]|uniref:discoidin domain-containing protein n=1 Tax=Dactylosporangium sp. NPDC049525 TaxID=3154730 RepID=UPI00342FF81F
MTAQSDSGAAMPETRHRTRIRILAAAAVAAAVVAVPVATAFHAEAAAPPTPTGWTPNFLDDFTGNSLNGGNWQVDAGTSYPGGPANFGTGEVETSSASAVSVANGNLRITATGGGLGPWTAARIETNRADFQPPAGGKLRVEARLQLPEAPNGNSAGYWPAFWMLGGPYRGNWWNWPGVGEFDIMESVNGANRTWQTMHCGTSPGGVCNEKSGVGNGGPSGCTPMACTKGMHRYTLDWSRADNSATWYVDGRQVWRTQRGGNIDPAAWDAATNHGFIIILNLAMGGEMPCNTLGCLSSGTGGGGHLDVDYVAAYTGPANAPPPALGPGDGTGTSPTPGPSTCGPLISQGRPTTSSGNENATLAPQYAVDGNLATRWSSLFSDPQWMQVDLGGAVPISRVKLTWEAAYASAYQIQVSNAAGGPWTVAVNNLYGAGGVEDLAVNATARYVRMYGTARATGYGYSLFEFQVYGACGTSPSPPAGTSSPPGGTSSPPGSTTPPPGQYPAWAPSTAYHVGDRVSYSGLNYQCRQAHTSIVTWEPSNTPALWLQI